jgi:hypothetical protein
MSLSKIALFAFGLAAVLVTGAVNADAATRFNRSHGGWTNSYYPGSDEEARFDHAKGFIN